MQIPVAHLPFYIPAVGSEEYLHNSVSTKKFSTEQAVQNPRETDEWIIH